MKKLAWNSTLKNQDHGIRSHNFKVNRKGKKKKSRRSDRFYLLRLQNHCGQWLQPWNQKALAPWKDSFDKPRKHFKKERHSFADKGLISQSYVFSSSHVWMWVLDHKEGSGPKNWCFCIVVLEKTLESLLDGKEIYPVNPKGNQSWIFTGPDAKAEAPVLWPPYTKIWLIGKKTWCCERLKVKEGGSRGSNG